MYIQALAHATMLRKVGYTDRMTNEGQEAGSENEAGGKGRALATELEQFVAQQPHLTYDRQACLV